MQRKMGAENAEAYRKLANCNIVFRFQPMSTECNAWLCWSGAQTSQGGRGSARSLGPKKLETVLVCGVKEPLLISLPR